VRSFDLVARYGGEEFLIVMPETGLSVAYTVAERIRRGIAERPMRISGAAREVAVTVSVGVATVDGADDSAAALLRRADDALYAAKGNGRNQVVCADEAPAPALRASV
jgi:two-component system cell cycle response regulator